MRGAGTGHGGQTCADCHSWVLAHSDGYANSHPRADGHPGANAASTNPNPRADSQTRPNGYVGAVAFTHSDSRADGHA